MQAVIEVPNFDFEPPQPWPVASAEPYSWVPIDGGCSDAEVGLFVSGLTGGLEVAEPGGREDVVARLLVRRDLVGFLSRVQTWTERNGLGSNGTVLVEVIDRNFDVTAPLRFPAD